MELKVQGSQVAKVCRAEYLRGESYTDSLDSAKQTNWIFSWVYEYEDASYNWGKNYLKDKREQPTELTQSQREFVYPPARVKFLIIYGASIEKCFVSEVKKN